MPSDQRRQQPPEYSVSTTQYSYQNEAIRPEPTQSTPISADYRQHFEQQRRELSNVYSTTRPLERQFNSHGDLSQGSSKHEELRSTSEVSDDRRKVEVSTDQRVWREIPAAQLSRSDTKQTNIEPRHEQRREMMVEEAMSHSYEEHISHTTANSKYGLW